MQLHPARFGLHTRRAETTHVMEEEREDSARVLLRSRDRGDEYHPDSFPRSRDSSSQAMPHLHTVTTSTSFCQNPPALLPFIPLTHHNESAPHLAPNHLIGSESSGKSHHGFLPVMSRCCLNSTSFGRLETAFEPCTLFSSRATTLICIATHWSL